jgi:hypothetical protein
MSNPSSRSGRESTSSPPHAPADLPEDFGHWFAGFADGEGNFDVRPAANGRSYTCRFAIGLRADDLPILEEIVRMTGLGSIRLQDGGAGEQKRQARWSVERKEHLARLVEIFDRFPLRAKKARDYVLWRRAVVLWLGVRSRRRHDWFEIAAISAELRAQRRFAPVEGEESAEPVSPQLRLVG